MTQPANLYCRLRAGDEQAFRTVVTRHQASLIAVAQAFVRSRATAEEVVQDTWLAVIEGLDTFEGRSSLKNWIFAILANKARTRAVRDGRMVQVADFAGETGEDTPAVDPARFKPSGAWADFPAAWDDLTPERIVADKDMLARAGEAIASLPPGQRSVVTLRTIEHMEAAEVSVLLGISDANQRVLLHRARAALREAMERLLAD
ncbi:RNA polymerase sigma factor [Bauldia litoralis]|uniref:RNA polymerase sigma-70 factor, ECF subfamily n=1 Tax=Bauldia litoralis TaxID=665467 RepID=A0A1G6DZ57_9HYPH|nr:sigma-70 family RNA polymerase sigma factor [Bauldia litoralis]SDB50433.1 RNA polymerase sigma-70 factor, ECF subfamily [Bauldia litoralis]